MRNSNVKVNDVVMVFGGYNACSTGYGVATVTHVGCRGNIKVLDANEFHISKDGEEYEVVWSDKYNAYIPA